MVSFFQMSVHHHRFFWKSCLCVFVSFIPLNEHAKIKYIHNRFVLITSIEPWIPLDAFNWIFIICRNNNRILLSHKIKYICICLHKDLKIYIENAQRASSSCICISIVLPGLTKQSSYESWKKKIKN